MDDRSGVSLLDLVNTNMDKDANGQSLDLNSALAHYFQVSVSDFYTVFDLVRRLSHTLGIGFVLPLLLMLLSSELRPFLLNFLSSVFCVSTNNVIHQVYE